MFFVAKLSCALLLALSVMMGISSGELIMFWFSLELNTLAFVALLKFGSMTCGVKYFIPQSLGSLLLLAGLLMVGSRGWDVGDTLVLTSAILKLGFPPFHFWMISLAMELEWDAFVLLSSAQKILPLVLMSSVGTWAVPAMVALGMGVSLPSMMCQSHFKKILSYSSVLSLSWVIGGSPDIATMMIYLGAYFFGLSSLLLGLGGFQSFTSLKSVQSRRGGLPVLAGASFSLGGFPPTLGFFAKVLVLGSALANSLPLSAVLVASSPFGLYVYLRLSLLSMKLSGFSSVPAQSLPGQPLLGAGAAVSLLAGGLVL